MNDELGVQIGSDRSLLITSHLFPQSWLGKFSCEPPNGTSTSPRRGVGACMFTAEKIGRVGTGRNFGGRGGS